MSNTKAVMGAGAQQMGTDQGKGVVADAAKIALFLKVFGGEVLTAFTRRSVTMGNHMIRTIQNGKSASFPVLGRSAAKYLKRGQSLDDQRTEIKHSEKVIAIDGLLTDDVLIYDIEDAMNHFDVRAEYSAQIGESLAIAADGAVLAEMAKMCNLAAAKDENIEGLGKASVLNCTADTTSAAAWNALTPAKQGEAIIGQLTKARAALTKNYVPAGDRFFYTTPDAYSAILAAMMPNAANYAALIDPETGNIRNVMGFTVIEVPHLTAGGVGGDSDLNGTDPHGYPASATSTAKVGKDSTVGLFNHRTAVATLKLKDMALERARRPEYQADQIIAKYAMGHGGLRPEACGALVSFSKA